MKIKWQNLTEFKWFKKIYIFYIFGFVLNFRPASPFLYEFVITNKNFTEHEVIERVLPVLFYSSSIVCLPVFILTVCLMYNPVNFTAATAGLITTFLYIWADSKIDIEIAQGLYGLTTAAEFAYYVYIYECYSVEKYQRFTSYAKAAPLLGKLAASLIAQIFVSTNTLSYKDLYYFNLGAFIISAVLAFFIPPIPLQISANLEKPEQKQIQFDSILSTFKISFPNKYVVKWSIWSILTICGYNQFSIYIQPLWKFIQTTNNVVVYNGFLEGVSALFSFFGTILGGYAVFDWKYKGDLILSMTSLVEAFMLIFMSQITNTLLNSIFYIFIGFMYHFIITILFAEIAKVLSRRQFEVTFGLIALIAWGLASVIVVLLNSELGLQIDNSQDLFMIYGFYHLILSVLFIIIGLSYWFAKHTYE